MYYVAKRIGGSVAECSPATQAAWVRFPADAFILEWNQTFGNVFELYSWYFEVLFLAHALPKQVEFSSL